MLSRAYTLARGGAPIRPEPPWYKVDEDGYLKAINFQHYMPTYHPGWRGIPSTNWLAPEDEKIKREIRQLAPMPSYRELCELIDWPMMRTDKRFRDRRLPGYRLFAARANRSIKVWELDGHAFLVLPFPETFSDYPAYMEKVRAWRPPAGLEQLTNEQAERIKTFHKRANGAFVKAIARLRKDFF